MVRSIKIRIKGSVQGVGYRNFITRYDSQKSGRNKGLLSFIKKVADRFEVNGYVKNEADSSVVIIASGEEKIINKIIDFCNNGPRFARIDKIEISDIVLEEEFNNFEVRI